jgi:hypothetical protein
MKLKIRGEELEIKNCGEGDCENGVLIKRLVETIAGTIVIIEALAGRASSPELKSAMLAWRDKVLDSLDRK